MDSPTCTRSQIDNWQFHCWYETFKAVTFKAVTVQLPDLFADYLAEDGVMMPSKYVEGDDSSEGDFGEGESEQDSDSK